MSGALLLGMFTVVLVVDTIIALRFRAMADRAESNVGAAPKADATATDPAALRRVANLLLTSGPLMWLVVALLSFGIIPIGGIVPIKF